MQTVFSFFLPAQVKCAHSVQLLFIVFCLCCVASSQNNTQTRHELKTQYRQSIQYVPEKPPGAHIQRSGTPNVIFGHLPKTDFEDGLMPPTGWEVFAVGSDVNPVWENRSGVSGYGVGIRVARYIFFDQTTEGNQDTLLSPMLTGLKAADTLMFDWAYSSYYTGGPFPDSLEVLISYDGGTTYTQVFVKWGTTDGTYDLRTAPMTTSSFVPTSTQWKTFKHVLGNDVVGANVCIMFRTTNHYGNHLWLDNIQTKKAQAEPFSLTEPANNTNPIGLTPLLKWGASDGALSYDVLLDQNTTPATVIGTNVTNTQFMAGLLSPATQYYWTVKAHSNNGVDVVAENGPFTFTTGTPPLSPTNLTITNPTTTTLDLLWTDASTDEEGFRVYRSLTGVFGTFMQVGSDLPAGTQTFNDNGLSPATRYYYEVRSFIGILESEGAAGNKPTLAVPPGTPTFGTASYHFIPVIPNNGANPDGTQMAIQVEGPEFLKTITKFVGTGGILVDTPVWKTRNGWSENYGLKVNGLYPNTQYTFRIKARNPDNVETSFGPDTSKITLAAKDIDAASHFESFTNTSVWPPDGWTNEDVDKDGNIPNASGTFGRWHLSTSQFFGNSSRYFSWDYPAQVPGAPGGTAKYINPITGLEEEMPANDYLYTLPVRLTAGQLYNVTFLYRTVEGYPHNVAIVLATRPNRMAIIDTLSDQLYDTQYPRYINYGGFFVPSTGFFEGIVFTPPISGTYYIGFWEHSPVNSVTFRLHDITIRKIPSSDLFIRNAIQENPYPELGYTATNKNAALPLPYDEENEEENMPELVLHGTASPTDTKSFSHPYIVPAPVKSSPVRMKFSSSSVEDIPGENIVYNLGGPVTGGQWSIKWKPGVNASTLSTPGVNITTDETKSIPFTFSPLSAGTYYTTAQIDLPGDVDALNDTVKIHLLSYPEEYTVLDYDSAGVKPPYRTNITGANPLAGAVRFTVPENKFYRVLGMYSYYKNTTAAGSPFNDSLTVKIHAKGDDTLLIRNPSFDTIQVPKVGPPLYQKKFGRDYLYHFGSIGQNFFLPLDSSFLAFGPGDEFFLSIRLGVGSSNPLGATDQNQTGKPEYYRSWGSVNGGASWRSMDSTAWFIKAFTQPLNAIIVRKHIDNDGSLATDNDRTPIETFTVSLKNSGNNLIATLTSDEEGKVVFAPSAENNFLPDGNYTVSEVAQTGFTYVTGSTIPVTLAGGNVSSVDFFLFENGSLGGILYHDVNGNRTPDDEENAIAGRKIVLSLNGDSLTGTFSDDNGGYFFSNLGPGNYSLGEILPAGWGESVTPDDYALESGTNAPDNDFGSFIYSSISGVTYLDENGDATRNDGEAGLAGITITLSETIEKNADELTATTDSNGVYVFDEVPPGNYRVNVSQHGLDARTEGSSGYDGIVTDGNGTISDGNNFGFQYLGVIAGTVYHDNNRNSVYDADDTTGIPGATVTLTFAEQNKTATTDNEGMFAFTGLTEGTYSLSITFPKGYSKKENGDGVEITLTAAGEQSVRFGGYYDGMTFRTFKDTSSLSVKAVKLKYVKKSNTITGTPNEGTILENIFATTIGKAGATFLGVAQSDPIQAKTKGWIYYKKASDLQKMFTAAHTGTATAIDSLRADGKKAKLLSKAIKAERKKYNNILWSQGILLHLNLYASQDSITAPNFGALQVDTAFVLFGRNLQDQPLTAVARILDSLMTEWKSHGVSVADTGTFRAFALLLQRINDGFYEVMNPANYELDSANVQTGKKPYAVTLKGTKGAHEVGIVKNVGKFSEPFIFSGNSSEQIPPEFALQQNYPNPFNPTTTLSFVLGHWSFVTLKVYDVLGREVATLLKNEAMEEGEHEVEFNASGLTSGVYFYRLNVAYDEGSFTSVKKFVLMK